MSSLQESKGQNCHQSHSCTCGYLEVPDDWEWKACEDYVRHNIYALLRVSHVLIEVRIYGYPQLLVNPIAVKVEIE